jgi:hypothetical protein
MPVTIPDPWLSFLRDVDEQITQPSTLHCLGGFVLAVLWSLPRFTGDLDFIEIAPSSANDELLRIAGDGSYLANKYHLHFQRVPVAEYPEGYASRLVNITPDSLRKLTLLGFEVHDLVLAKVVRFAPRDRDDIAFLVKERALDRDVLLRRSEEELRPYVLNESRYQVNLDLCLEEFLPRKSSKES